MFTNRARRRNRFINVFFAVCYVINSCVCRRIGHIAATFIVTPALRPVHTGVSA
jgi:hypothetical protein